MTAEDAKSILVIDDELDIASVIKMSLDRSGFKTACYSNPLLALQEFEQNSAGYDLVLSDIRMPQLSGFEVARKIRAIKPSTKIILMTAFEITSTEFQTVLPSVKIDGLIQKPITMKNLVSAVAAYF